MSKIIPSDPLRIGATADHSNMPSIAVDTACDQKSVCPLKVEGSHWGSRHGVDNRAICFYTRPHSPDREQQVSNSGLPQSTAESIHECQLNNNADNTYVS
jgi:hypothetical protein